MNVTLLNTVNLDGGTSIKKGGTKLNNQEKTIDIRENGTTTVVPDKDFTGLSKVAVNVNIVDEDEPIIIHDAIRFLDYDGTILYTYSPQEIEEMTELPPLPSHEGLICQEWNYTLDDIKAQPLFCDVGATYITDDGATRLCIEIVNPISDKTVALCIETTKSNNVYIDWGDGQLEILEHLGVNNCTHTYEIGTYIIQIYSVDNSLYKLGSRSTTPYVPMITNNYPKYDTRIKEIYIGNNVSINCLGSSSNLEILTIPNHLLSFTGGISNGQLKCLIFPRGCTSMSGYGPSWPLGSPGAQNFRASIPNTVTSVRSGLAQTFGSDRIIYPKSVTQFSNMYNYGKGYAKEVLYSNSMGGYPMIKYVFPLQVSNSASGTSSPTIQYLILDGKIGNRTSFAYSLGGYIHNVVRLSDKKLYPLTTVELEQVSASSCRKYPLKTVIIRDGVTSIGNYAFYECRNLTSVTIPNSVTTIENWAFSSCRSLPSVTIPDSVTTIGESAFKDCSSLKSVTIGNGVTTIGSQAFLQCSFKNIVIPDSVVSCGKACFSKCANLEEVHLSANLTSIPESMFEYCSNLSSISIPDNVTTIGNSGFYHCEGLRDVTLPNSVTSIGSSAFAYTGLRQVNIPPSVTSIGGSAFNSSYELDIIDFSRHETIPSLGSSAISSTTSQYIIVPDFLYNDWIAATNWSAIASSIIKKSDWDAQNA